jgi:hypothetical protein
MSWPPARRTDAAKGPAQVFSQTSTPGDAARRERLADGDDVLLGEQHRELGLVRQQLAGRALGHVAELVDVDRAVLVLADEHEVENTNELTLDERLELFRDLSGEVGLVGRELDDQPVDGPQYVGGICHKASLPPALARDLDQSG